MTPTVILPTRKFKTAFFRCVSRNPQNLTVVSPYVGGLPGFKNIVDFTRHLYNKIDGFQFRLITRPPSNAYENLNTEQAKALSLLGVDLLVRTKPILHSKIYQFYFPEGDSASFIGSANFTLGGFERNEESVAYFRDPSENKKISQEINRLSTYGSIPFNLWKIQIKKLK